MKLSDRIVFFCLLVLETIPVIFVISHYYFGFSDSLGRLGYFFFGLVLGFQTMLPVLSVIFLVLLAWRLYAQKFALVSPKYAIIFLHLQVLLFWVSDRLAIMLIQTSGSEGNQWVEFYIFIPMLIVTILGWLSYILLIRKSVGP